MEPKAKFWVVMWGHISIPQYACLYYTNWVWDNDIDRAVKFADETSAIAFLNFIQAKGAKVQEF